MAKLHTNQSYDLTDEGDEVSADKTAETGLLFFFHIVVAVLSSLDALPFVLPFHKLGSN